MEITASRLVFDVGFIGSFPGLTVEDPFLVDGRGTIGVPTPFERSCKAS